MFVLYAVGTNTDKRFAHVYPREELPSLTIELLLSVAIPRRALKSLKRKISTWVLLWYDFLGKIDQKLNNRD